jgi:hypothetical protein
MNSQLSRLDMPLCAEIFSGPKMIIALALSGFSLSLSLGSISPYNPSSVNVLEEKKEQRSTHPHCRLLGSRRHSCTVKEQTISGTENIMFT